MSTLAAPLSLLLVQPLWMYGTLLVLWQLPNFMLSKDGEDTQMTTNEIRLPFELFIGRPASKEGERDIVLTEVMVIGLVRELLEYHRQYDISG